MPTLLGATNGVFGIPGQQTGFLLDSSSQAYSADEKTVKNITGDDTGISFYNEKIELSLGGFVPATSAFSGTISASIALATAPTDHLVGSISAGIFIAKTITKTQASEDYQKVELSVTYNPTIVAS